MASSRAILHLAALVRNARNVLGTSLGASVGYNDDHDGNNDGFGNGSDEVVLG